MSEALMPPRASLPGAPQTLQLQGDESGVRNPRKGATSSDIPGPSHIWNPTDHPGLGGQTLCLAHFPPGPAEPGMSLGADMGSHGVSQGNSKSAE